MKLALTSTDKAAWSNRYGHGAILHCKKLSQDQCFSKLPDISILSLVHLRWGMLFVKCFWQTSTHTYQINYTSTKEGNRGINKKKIDMSPLKITCRVKLIGAKWGLVTFRFLVWRVVFTENAAGSRGRETSERLLHFRCVHAVIYTIRILWDVYWFWTLCTNANI